MQVTFATLYINQFLLKSIPLLDISILLQQPATMPIQFTGQLSYMLMHPRTWEISWGTKWQLFKHTHSVRTHRAVQSVPSSLEISGSEVAWEKQAFSGKRGGGIANIATLVCWQANRSRAMEPSLPFLFFWTSWFKVNLGCNPKGTFLRVSPLNNQGTYFWVHWLRIAPSVFHKEKSRGEGRRIKYTV